MRKQNKSDKDELNGFDYDIDRIVFSLKTKILGYFLIFFFKDGR